MTPSSVPGASTEIIDLVPPTLPSRRGKKDPKVIGLWRLGRVIGEGSSGRVKLARNVKTNTYAAVKIIEKQQFIQSRTASLAHSASESERIFMALERECTLMKLTDHPNIMRLYDVWETSRRVFMILEYVPGGELFDLLVDQGKLDTVTALAYFQQLISACDYLHRNNIAHRDLKPENILLSEDKKTIKIADFGMAAWVPTQKHMLATSCGSPHYAAPEVILGEKYDGERADVWSCGIILFALLVGRLPFDDDDIHVLLEKVKYSTFDWPTEDEIPIDPQAKELIGKMLQKDAQRRFSFENIMRHPFFISEPMSNTLTSYGKSARDQAPPIFRSIPDSDASLLKNMRALWREETDEEIISHVTASTPDGNLYAQVWQALINYRAQHSRAQDTKAEEQYRSQRRAARRRREQEETETALRDREILHDDLPPRAAPPTPKRACGPGMNLDALHSPSPSSSPASPLVPAIAAVQQLCTLDPADEQGQRQHLDMIQMMINNINLSNKAKEILPMNAQHSHILNSSTPPLLAQKPMPRVPRQRRTKALGYRHRDSKENDEEARQPVSSHKVNRNGPKPVQVKFVDSEALTQGHKRSLLKRHFSPFPSTSPNTRSADLIAPSTPRTWVTNIFSPRIGAHADANFKTSMELLSRQDAGNTEDEIKRLLNGLQVHIDLGHGQVGSHSLYPDRRNVRSGILECTLRPPPGKNAKPSRFRVEVVRGLSEALIEEGYQGALRVVYEKGPTGVFTQICQSLGRQWSLDLPVL